MSRLDTCIKEATQHIRNKIRAQIVSEDEYTYVADYVRENGFDGDYGIYLEKFVKSICIGELGGEDDIRDDADLKRLQPEIWMPHALLFYKWLENLSITK